MPERPSYIPPDNPFRKRGQDPQTGKQQPEQAPGTFVEKYLGTDAGKEVDKLAGERKEGIKATRVQDLGTLLTQEEHARVREQEKLPDLEQQYEEQVLILQKQGYLETLSSGQEGIADIDGQEHPVPTLEQITVRLMERNKETQGALETKVEQGFTKLLIVPFGLSLTKHLKLHTQTILEHYQAGTLADAHGIKVPLDTNQPLWARDELTKEGGADLVGAMVYHPTSFDRDIHGGTTKHDLLNQDPIHAFELYLLEADQDMHTKQIPREGKGTTRAGRSQIEAGTSVGNYLRLYQAAAQDPTNPYHLEAGLTPEAQLTLATLHLAETNQVLDDYQTRDSSNQPLASIALLTAAYLPASNDVPIFAWDNGQARLEVYPAFEHGRDVGVRSAVRI